MPQIAQISDLDSLTEILRSAIASDTAEEVQLLIADKAQEI